MLTTTNLAQKVIDHAVAIATRAAMNGQPVARIIWIPPQNTTDNPRGVFAVEPYVFRSGADTPPWEGY